MAGVFQLAGDRCGLRPVSRTFVIGQKCQPRLGFEPRALQLEQCRFRSVKQTGFKVIQGQCVLGAVAVVFTDVAARQEVLVHTNRTLVLATAAKQIAQGKVQFRRVGVVLYRLDKRINSLVLLLVQQKIEASEIRLGRLAVLQAQLAKVHARSQPAQHKGHRQTHQNQGRIKVHRAGRRCRVLK